MYSKSTIADVKICRALDKRIASVGVKLEAQGSGLVLIPGRGSILPSVRW